MRPAEIITAAAICAIGFALAASSWLLGPGWGNAGPDAGFFPFWVGLLLSLTAIALLVQSMMLQEREKPFLEREQLVRVAKVAVPTVAAVALIQVVGFYFAAALYLTGYMRWIGRHSWPLVLTIGLGMPLLTFVLFETWFYTPMRKGPIETWLGF